MLIRRFGNVGRKLAVGSAGLLLGWTGTGLASAQPPLPLPLSATEQAVAPSAAPVQRNYINKNTIQLPIKISEQSRPLISEIQLYVKDGPTGTWTQRDKVGPSAKAFTYQVPKDGEYWFAMVTVDKQGRGYPSDLRNEPPGLIVVIDTQMPEIELTNLGNTPEGQLVQCEVRDANLDNAGMRFFYQGGDKVFRVVDPVPGRPGVFCIPNQAVFTGVVRATADDLAGNQALREVSLSQLTTTTKASAPLQLPKGPELPPALDLKKPSTLEPGKLPIGIGGATDVKPIETPKTPGGATRPDYKGGPNLQPIEHVVEKINPLPLFPQETLKRQFVNSTRLFLDYQIENAGQNSVAKVEVWITSDRAKSWQKLGEQSQQKSPIEVALPGEGIFGVTLVASNSRGVPGAPPQAGDQPDMWVEVDTTKPSAQLTKVQATTEDGKSVVHIHWAATDKNLDDGSVELWHSTTPQGPWQPIAKGLKAEGQHRWTPGADVTRSFIRLNVRDSAGNTTTVTTQDAVTFEEPSRPRAVIRGISTGAPLNK